MIFWGESSALLSAFSRLAFVVIIIGGLVEVDTLSMVWCVQDSSVIISHFFWMKSRVCVFAEQIHEDVLTNIFRKTGGALVPEFSEWFTKFTYLDML